MVWMVKLPEHWTEVLSRKTGLLRHYCLVISARWALEVYAVPAALNRSANALPRLSISRFNTGARLWEKLEVR